MENNQDWKERFKKTKFAKSGGSSFECSDYEGMYSDLLNFISLELKAQEKRLNEEFEKRMNEQLELLVERIIKRLEGEQWDGQKIDPKVIIKWVVNKIKEETSKSI